MTTIGIIGAMDEEVLSLKNEIEIVSTKNIVDVEFCLGKAFGNNIVLVRSGIGKVNAAICTQVLIDLYGVDIVINTGVAGGIASVLKVGDIVISNDLVYHDMDVTAFGLELGQIPRMDKKSFSASTELIELFKNSSEKLQDINVYIERIATGDQFVFSKKQKDKIWSEFKAYCAEMEGAAIAHTCYLNKVPFVVVRTISDVADEASNKTYKLNLEKAAICSSNLVIDVIKQYKEI